MVWDVEINGLVTRALLVAGAVAAVTGYVGDWELGVQLADVQNTVSGSQRARGSLTLVPYSKNSYRRTTTVSTMELAAGVGSVVATVMGPLNRALSGGRVAIACLVRDGAAVDVRKARLDRRRHVRGWGRAGDGAVRAGDQRGALAEVRLTRAYY